MKPDSCKAWRCSASCTRNTAVRQALGRPSATATRWRRGCLSDPFWPQLADRLAAADRAGIEIPALARTASEQGPLFARPGPQHRSS